jgi:hypothetical protein
MRPIDVFTEQALVNIGIDPDSAWELSRNLDTIPDLDIPDPIAPNIRALANLYELTNYDPARIKEFLLFLGEKAVNFREPPEIGSPRSFIWLAGKSILTAQFFDVEMEQLAISEMHLKGKTVDAIKSGNYGRFGISAALVMWTNIPSTRARMVRQLTHCAFMDGFGIDHDLSGVMTLIEEDPSRVKGLVGLGLYAEPLRIYCEMIVNRGLSKESIQEKYPGLNDKQINLVLNNAEAFALLMLGSVVEEETGEEEKTETLHNLVDKFIDANAKNPTAVPINLTSEIIYNHVTQEQIINLFRRLKKHKPEIVEQIEHLRKYHNLVMPIYVIKDGENVTIDQEWLERNLGSQG